MNIMNSRDRFDANLPSSIDPRQMLRRLIINLAGVVYRRRHDNRWTMEFISDTCRDLTGYDGHRFRPNQSLAFAELIHPDDQVRVRTAIDAALGSKRRLALTYRIRAAHGTFVTVEDRLVGVYDDMGAVVAIEGVIDRAAAGARPLSSTQPEEPAPGDPVHVLFSPFNFSLCHHEQA